jgi:hypothetical protein
MVVHYRGYRDKPVNDGRISPVVMTDHTLAKRTAAI